MDSDEQTNSSTGGEDRNDQDIDQDDAEVVACANLNACSRTTNVAAPEADLKAPRAELLAIVLPDDHSAYSFPDHQLTEQNSGQTHAAAAPDTQEEQASWKGDRLDLLHDIMPDIHPTVASIPRTGSDAARQLNDGLDVLHRHPTTDPIPRIDSDSISTNCECPVLTRQPQIRAEPLPRLQHHVLRRSFQRRSRQQQPTTSQAPSPPFSDAPALVPVISHVATLPEPVPLITAVVVEQTATPSLLQKPAAATHRTWCWCASIMVVALVTTLTVAIKIVRAQDSLVDWRGDPSPSPITFATLLELQQAVDAYLQDPSPNTTTAALYGWPMNVWDVSQVTSLRSLFSRRRNPATRLFNEPIGAWDTSKVTDLQECFWGAAYFAQDISRWNVSQVLRMDRLFQGAEVFNIDLSTWDVSRVTSLAHTFRWASAFNQPLANWDVSRVRFMNRAFAGARRFDQDLDTWDVSRVTTFFFAFEDAVSFNGDLSTWNVAKPTTYRACLMEPFRSMVIWPRGMYPM